MSEAALSRPGEEGAEAGVAHVGAQNHSIGHQRVEMVIREREGRVDVRPDIATTSNCNNTITTIATVTLQELFAYAKALRHFVI
jgi:hypothetical protein